MEPQHLLINVRATVPSLPSPTAIAQLSLHRRETWPAEQDTLPAVGVSTAAHYQQFSMQSLHLFFLLVSIKCWELGEQLCVCTRTEVLPSVLQRGTG